MRPADALTVLVVDDSAVVRQVLGAVLGAEPGFKVVLAANPLIAMDKMRREPPDVVVLDLEMPGMDGLTFLRKLMAESPLPVVICSGLGQRGTEAAMTALEEGAVEVIEKPKFGVGDFLVEAGSQIIRAVRAAARSNPAVRRRQRQAVQAPRAAAFAPAPASRLPLSAYADKVIALGASTGGTDALRLILEQMPLDAPGIVVVQHMPPGFTAAFARRLASLCRIEVREARDGDRVQGGRALIAAGGHHLRLRRDAGGFQVEVHRGPTVSGHCPSVDVLFESVAEVAGSRAVGALLTGMGADGARGLLRMREGGARTLAQDEASCVVYGMPKEAVALGAVETITPLNELGARILEAVVQRAPAR